MLKKIGLILYSTRTGGGIVQYTESIVNAFSRNNLNNEFILFCDFDDTRFDDTTFQIRKLKRETSNFLFKLLRLFSIIFGIRFNLLNSSDKKEIYNDIDIFLSPIITPYPFYYTKKPYIFTLHDLQEHYYPENFSFIERLKRNFFIKSLSLNAYKILCESKSVKDDIIKFYKISDKKIFVLQAPPKLNYLNFKYNEFISSSIIKKFNLNYKYVFYPASFWKHKNHLRLIQSFLKVNENLPFLHLVLTGNNDLEYYKIIKLIGTNKNIHILGKISDEEMQYLYVNSEFLILPTLFESISIPIYEAFYLEVPVCCSNIVQLQDQILDNAYTFDPLDINDIAEKIIYLFNNIEIRKYLTKKAKLSINNFDHDLFFNKIKNIIYL